MIQLKDFDVGAILSIAKRFSVKSLGNEIM
jgi:hypothetical protein